MNMIDQELIWAAAGNDLPEFRRLLSIGADVNAMGDDDDDDDTALHKASYFGNVQLVKELVEHGVDMEAKDIVGMTPLHLACSQGHLAVVNDLVGSNGATTTILGKRKSRGANIEAKDNHGNTPLHVASVHNHLPVVKSLLSGGAYILAVNERGELPIHKALEFRSSAVSKCLLQHFYATIIRRLPLHELLKDLAWIRNPDSRVGVLPLFTALDENMLDMDDVVDILEYVVERNPELISSRDQDGALPLHVACRRGSSFTIVQSLVNLHKASVKSVTPQGDLPLFLACEMPEPSLDTIFTLVKLYPDFVYR
jgi:ankyrin repeat protein